jgi:serine/threonine protein kinase
MINSNSNIHLIAIQAMFMHGVFIFSNVCLDILHEILIWDWHPYFHCLVYRYVVIKTLGRGNFGKVKLCLNMLDERQYAVKVGKLAYVQYC